MNHPDLYSNKPHLYSRRAPDEAAGAQCDGAVCSRDQRAPAAARAGPAQVSTAFCMMNRANSSALSLVLMREGLILSTFLKNYFHSQN